MTLFCSAKEFHDLYRQISDRSLSLRIQVKGGSMYPFIKSGDWVDVVPFKNGTHDIKKGEIILFRKDDSLYMHRVIKGKGDVFIAKGDMSFGHDGAVLKKSVLGKVVSVQRGERTIDLCSGKSVFIGNLIASHGLLLQYPALFARAILKFAAAFFFRIQGLKAYRLMLKKILRQGIVVRDVEPEDEEQVRDLYVMAGYDVKKGIIDIRKKGSWLVAQRGERIVGGLTLARHEKDPALWVIFGLEVKPLIRGLGIGEEMVKDALSRARSGGAKEVGLFVNKKAKAALGLYKKLGFRAADASPEFNRSEDEFYLSYKIDG